MTKTIVLVDGEHHPPVTRAAIAQATASGAVVVAAVNLGGGEKLTDPLRLGETPVVDAGRAGEWPAQRAALERAIDTYRPAVILDLSDAPVIDEQARLRLAAVALARGVGYSGAGFSIEAPNRPRLCERPSIAVIGSAKRAGKTAVSAHLARTLAASGRIPVVVAMGRGGPAEPQLVRGDLRRPDATGLLEIAGAGGHAASDVYEDAVVAGVASVGARRAGAGLVGAPYHHTVHEAVAVANGAGADVVVLEGSGTAVPPVAADSVVLVLRAGDDPASGLGLYRLLIADLIVATMCEEPIVSPRQLSDLSSSLTDLAGDVVLVRTVFRPRPVEPIRGRTIFYATTAPEAVSDILATHLEREHGATVAGITHRLADRDGLRRDLAAAAGRYEVLVTELKAAAVDVAARAAADAGVAVVFADNEVVALDGDLDAELLRIADLAAERFEATPAPTR